MNGGVFTFLSRSVPVRYQTSRVEVQTYINVRTLVSKLFFLETKPRKRKFILEFLVTFAEGIALSFLHYDFGCYSVGIFFPVTYKIICPDTY